MFFPRYSISKVLALYRAPWQVGQGAYTLGRNRSSTITNPSPWQCSHRPLATLNENLPASYRLDLASFVEANSLRIGSNSPVYVARFERGVRPIGFWSTRTSRRSRSIPLTMRPPRVTGAADSSSGV